MPAHYMVTLIVPIVLIALAIPMALRKVPRNRLYGFRTPYALSSDPVWYRANKISGVALLCSGVFWLALGQIAPRVMSSQRDALRRVSFFGAAAVLLACAVSAWLTYRRSG